MPEMTVYSRPGCHLCELAVEELEPLCRSAGIGLRVVDVDTDPALRAAYGLRVPVVCGGGEELTGWPLDRSRVLHWLGRP